MIRLTRLKERTSISGKALYQCPSQLERKVLSHLCVWPSGRRFHVVDGELTEGTANVRLMAIRTACLTAISSQPGKSVKPGGSSPGSPKTTQYCESGSEY